MSLEEQAVCAICLRPRSARKDGCIKIRGPHSDCCPGSGKPPRTADARTTNQMVWSTTEVPSKDNELSDQTTTPLTIPSRPPNVNVLKRIPKDSREKASTKLTAILDQVVSQNGCSA